MDTFKWMEPILPDIQHLPYSAAMKKKSVVMQLPIQHKNEAKYEDCLDIMDNMEVFLQKTFREAHGACILKLVLNHIN